MRKHGSLEGRQVVGWADQIAQHDQDAEIAAAALGTDTDDEIEAQLDIALDAPSGGAGAVSFKRAEFQYGSCGSSPSAANDPVGTKRQAEPQFGSAGSRPIIPLKSPMLKAAIELHGAPGARRQIGNGVGAGLARARMMMRNIGNGRRG